MQELIEKYGNNRDAIKNAFRVLDKDKSGFIDAKELKVRLT